MTTILFAAVFAYLAGAVIGILIVLLVAEFFAPASHRIEFDLRVQDAEHPRRHLRRIK